MTFISVRFLLFLLVTLLVFYAFPVKNRWIILLVASISFYYIACKEAFLFFLISICLSYMMGIFLYKAVDKEKKHCKVLLTIFLSMIIIPLFLAKEGQFILIKLEVEPTSIVIPLGISFYTLQIISYLVDIYSHKIVPEKNPFRYALYISYFPQILQGPIPRFQQLGEQLKIKNSLNERLFIKGFYLILWGCFLKLMIADKAGVVVDTVFASPNSYKGIYVFVAGILYSFQLYADFQGCVCIAQGVSELFGVSLANNFNHPYFAQSIAEFWRRWHISLSSWLRDYVYIPLGGNRKGIFRKYVNIIIVFLISGIWHGSGFKYVAWGLIHSGYQIIGSITKPLREHIYIRLGIKKNSIANRLFRTVFTFLCVMFSWIIFRASSLYDGLMMIFSIFTTYNPWILFNNDLLSLGLSWKEWLVLSMSIYILVLVSVCQNRISISNKILEQKAIVRTMIYLTVIVVMFVFGTYGYGFDASEFIYGGF